MSTNPFLKIKYWRDNYGKGDSTDQRAVSEFIECETDEFVNSFRLELSTIASGKFDVPTLDRVAGLKRSQMYGTYDAWARLMLQWMVGNKRRG